MPEAGSQDGVEVRDLLIVIAFVGGELVGWLARAAIHAAARPTYTRK